MCIIYGYVGSDCDVNRMWLHIIYSAGIEDLNSVAESVCCCGNSNKYNAEDTDAENTRNDIGMISIILFYEQHIKYTIKLLISLTCPLSNYSLANKNNLIFILLYLKLYSFYFS